MEIDDLKKTWDESFSSADPGSNIYRMILEHKSPLMMLEKKTKLAIWIFSLAAVLFAGTFYDHSLVRQSPVMWMLSFILFTEFIFSVFNLFLIKKIQNTQGNIRENLIKHINVLSNGFKQFLMLYISLYVLMVVLLEVSIYYQIDSLFDGWRQIAVLIRGIAYVFVIAIIYQLKRSSQHKHYGNYLVQLKTIMDQTN